MDFDVSSGSTVVPTTGDKFFVVRQVLGINTPYTVLYETTLAPSGSTSGTSLLSARADHSHANYVAKIVGGTPGHIAVLTSDGSIGDGGLPGAQYILPPASASQLGGVLQGDGVSISNTGVISVAGQLPTALPDISTAGGLAGTDITTINRPGTGIDYKAALTAILSWILANDGSIDPSTAPLVSSPAAGAVVLGYLPDGTLARMPYTTSGSSGAPANSTPPSISGTPQVGQTLNANYGAWTNSPTSYSYAWNRAGSPISGAINSTYVPVSADVGNTLTVTVIATNGSGASTPSTSAPTASVISASGRPSLTLSNPTFATSKFAQGLSGGTAMSPAITAGSGAGMGFWVVATSGNPYATILQMLGFASFGTSYGGADLSGDASNHPVSSSSPPGATSTPLICDGTQHWVYADSNGGTINAFIDGTGFRTENRTLGSSFTLTLAPANIAGCVISELALWSTSDTTRKTPPTAQLSASSANLLALWRLNGNGISA